MWEDGGPYFEINLRFLRDVIFEEIDFHNANKWFLAGRGLLLMHVTEESPIETRVVFPSFPGPFDSSVMPTPPVSTEFRRIPRVLEIKQRYRQKACALPSS